MEKILKTKTPHKISLKNSPCAFLYEQQQWQKGAYVCGIDEVGRGCLAGPVITCAVILHPFATHCLLKDSKILTETQRLTAAQWIIKNSWYAFGIQSAQCVDRYNIYQATKIAMKQALFGLLSQSPKRTAKTKLVLIDAMPLEPFLIYPELEILSFPFGESRSISIAAASILAKVKRDSFLKRLSFLFPHYELQNNKGYGTASHQKALKDQGPSLIHRTTFIKGAEHESASSIESNQSQQKSLFC